MRTEKELKRDRRDECEKRHFQLMVYFLLGVLLSMCVFVAGMSYALPKLTKGNTDEKIPTATAELVNDTIRASLGDYLTANKITISDDSMEEIVQYITDSVNSQTELTENEISEVKNLIKVSIQSANENVNTNTQNTNENLNNSVITLQEFVVNGDNEISDALKDYIDKYVIPGIKDSLEMNAEDIVSVNQTIVEMGNEYDSYRETNDTNLTEIVEMIERYREETGEEISECQTELTEKVNDFYVEYDSYVESTDSKIDSIEMTLGDYVAVTDFEEFKSGYEIYKEDIEDTVTEIRNCLNELEEGKADEVAFQELTSNFDSLKTAYDAFTGESGAFENLKNRVVNTETVTNVNSESIAALEERVAQLEGNLQKFYPVGSVYMTFGNENPADLYGGTWEKVEDTFLMCSGSTYPIGTAGGNNEVLLGAENIPSLNVTGKTNSFSGNTGSSGEHTHVAPDGSVFMAAKGGVQKWEIEPSLVNGTGAKWLWPSEGYSSFVNVSSAGNHYHNFTIPELDLSGIYTNNNLQSVDITNKYVTVNVWKRVA